MSATVWLSYRTPDPANLRPNGFRAEWYAHAIELHTRSFVNYREAVQFAERKAGKAGAILDGVPEHMRVR